MMVFLFVLAGIMATAPLCSNKKLVIGNKKYTGTQVYMLFWGIVLVTLVALRSFEIGNDTKMYQYIFNSYSKSNSFSSWIEDNWYTSGTELGFYFLGYIVSSFVDFRFFLILMSFVSVVPFIFVIHKYSDNKPLSLFLYVTFAYYTFSMSGLRQAAAMGLIMIAYHFMREKKIWKYLLFCGVAFSFHTTALLFIPMYWIGKVPNNKVTIFLALFGAAAAYLLRGYIWNLALLFSRQQYEVVESGGTLMYFFMLATVILGIYYYKAFIGNSRKYVKDLSTVALDNRDLFYLQVLALMICPIASVNPAISRVYFYYHMFVLLYYPKLLKVIPKKVEKIMVYSFVFIMALGFFFTKVCDPIQKYVPYYFMWQR